MSLRSQEYASLADHAYDSPGKQYALEDGKVSINGDYFKVLLHVDKPSGYQGTLYQDLSSGQIVVAHRGTEGGIELFKDGALADGGMVAQRFNAQARDGLELTAQALDLAQREGRRLGTVPPEVTVTGHSLGGCLAQISAHYYGLRGETFNAYGAASLNLRIPGEALPYRIPEGGKHVINHVMAGDAVSAASPHYGEVRVYAAQHEIDVMHARGYRNTEGFGVRNELGVAKDLLGSHSVSNFLAEDEQGRVKRSILADPQARLLADRNAVMIDRYRQDIGNDRAAITAFSRSMVGSAIDLGIKAYNTLPSGEPAQREQQNRAPATSPDQQLQLHQRDRFFQAPFSGMKFSATDHAPVHEPTPDIPAARPTYQNPSHPDHALFVRLREALPERVNDEKVAELTLAARQQRLQEHQITFVEIHNEHAVAKSNLPGAHAIVDLNAPAPPMDQTLQKAEVAHQQAQERLAQREQTREHAAGRTMG